MHIADLQDDEQAALAELRWLNGPDSGREVAPVALPPGAGTAPGPQPLSPSDGEALPGLMFSVDRHGHVLAASDGWLARVGHTRDDVSGIRAPDLLTPASRALSISTVLPALFATGRADDVEYQLVTRQGEILDVMVSAVVQRGGDGQPQRTLSVMHDITERRRAERALRDEQQRLARVIEGTQAGTWEYNAGTRDFQVSDTLAAMLGEPPGDSLFARAKGFTERVHPDDLPKLLQAWDETLQVDAPVHEIEYRMRHRDGHWVWILSRGKVVERDARGHAVKASGIHLDISARKTAQQAAQTLQHDLRSVIDAIPSMIGSWDHHLINRFANRAYADWFGVDARALPGTHISLLLGDEIYRQNLPFLEAALRGEQQVFERSIPRPDGSGLRHSITHYQPDLHDGEVRGLFVLAFDVSPIKEAQAQLEALNAALVERTRQAESANAAKSQFLAAMSHELRTPLTSIRGCAELLAQLLEEPQFRRMAGQIVKGSLHLNALLTDILDLARVDADAMPLTWQQHDLCALVQASAEFFALTAANKGLALSVHPEPGLPPSVRCDSLRVRQILNNLLSNALKFTRAGGVRIEIERLGDSILVHVDDTGPGIPPALRETVFEKFRQADGQVSHEHGGTGLGLALSRGLAELMQGRLSVTASASGGARFSLSLPINPPGLPPR